MQTAKTNRKYYGSNYAVVQAYVQEYSEDGRNSNESLWFEGDVLYSYGEHFPLAVRLNFEGSEIYVVNGDDYSMTTAQHRGIVFSEIPTKGRVEIPFTALGAMLTDRELVGRDSLGFGYRRTDGIIEYLMGEVEILDHTDEKWVRTGYDENGEPIKEHRLGATLFKDKHGGYFLSGLDGENYFLTQLEDPVETVKGAYESLKPRQAVVGEKLGREVKRQGEFFFVECPEGIEDVIAEGEIEKDAVIPHSDPERDDSHTATRLARVEDNLYAKGTVRHERSEHPMLRLYDEVPAPPLAKRSWWRVHENREVRSWTAEGGVD